jgi:hypothetical protein
MLNNDCGTCHASGFFPVILDNSAGGIGLQAISCMGSHGRKEDAGNDIISGGLGAGLRQHHNEAGITLCAGCHTDATPADYTPVGEDIPPVYYGTPDTDHPNKPTDPCNQSGNENFAGSTEGLDNDGDLLYDGNDPDCEACIPTGVSEAICNGVDDDCDDLIDEDFAPTPTTCGDGACAATGEIICDGGVERDTCTAGSPGSEGPVGDVTCSDTIDNDCDGFTDGLDADCEPELDADVFFIKLRVPKSVHLGTPGAKDKTIVAVVEQDTGAQNVHVTLDVTGGGVTPMPQTIIQPVTSGGGGTQFKFTETIECSSSGSRTLNWTATISSALENRDSNNDVITGTTEVICR